MNNLSDNKKWEGSLVIAHETAKLLGWVKAIKPNPDNSDEFTITVIPTQFSWLPQKLTGAYELSSNSVLTSGDLLIVAEDSAVEITPQSNLFQKANQISEKIFRITPFLITISSILLIAPVLAFIVIRLYEKIISILHARNFSGYQNRGWDDEGHAGFSRVPQPQPPGPQPPDNIELELPLSACEQGMNSSSVMRLL
ncbi:MAG: hypothetical protein ACFB0C_18785 [Leptolyngbyaceae cyanobacterium]|mgnify:CR=1 FL=1